MRNYLCILLCVGVVFPVQAKEGDKVGGGGDGIVAEFVTIAANVSEHLRESGASLNLPVTSEEFLQALDPKKLESTHSDLKYRGVNVDAYYCAERSQQCSNEGIIRINRSRWMNLSLSQKWKTVAHEIFRKIKDEGTAIIDDDTYEFSKRIVANKFSDLSQSIRPGDYLELSGDGPAAHIETDPNNSRVAIHFMGRVSQNILVMDCKSSATTCTFEGSFWMKGRQEKITLTRLADGNLVFDLKKVDSDLGYPFNFSFKLKYLGDFGSLYDSVSKRLTEVEGKVFESMQPGHCKAMLVTRGQLDFSIVFLKENPVGCRLPDDNVKLPRNWEWTNDFICEYTVNYFGITGDLACSLVGDRNYGINGKVTKGGNLFLRQYDNKASTFVYK